RPSVGGDQRDPTLRQLLDRTGEIRWQRRRGAWVRQHREQDDDRQDGERQRNPPRTALEDAVHEYGDQDAGEKETLQHETRGQDVVDNRHQEERERAKAGGRQQEARRDRAPQRDQQQREDRRRHQRGAT